MEELNEKNVEREERSKEAKWYVVHTYSGHENKVKANIEKMVENRGYIDDVFEVQVPKEEYIDNKGGANTIKERKMFPGYVLIKMIINDITWFLVRNTRGVTGFVGPGTKPVPLSPYEVKQLGIMGKQQADLDINIGDKVKIIDNSLFNGLIGDVESVNHNKKSIKAYVSMFGRETLVELGFNNIELI